MDNLTYTLCPGKILNMLVFLFSLLPLQAQKNALSCVAVNDCGVENAQPFLIKGENYTLPSVFEGRKEALTCNYGGTVIYAFDQLDIRADYQLEVVFLADHERVQRIVADGNEVQPPVTLEKGKEQHYRIDLPRKAYAYGQLVLVFESMKGGSNTIVSELNLYSTNPKKLEPFKGERKLELSHTQAYQVDTAVCAENKFPVYVPKPSSVNGIYKPEISLNGIWLFKENPEEEFYLRKTAGNDWKPIVVPGEWAMQGFRVDSAAFGGYQTTFCIPDEWKKEKRIRIRFDGVSNEAFVYLNGKEIGFHEGGKTAFEWDITDFLQRGENRLALKVRSESIADMLGSLTQYAAHQVGGITRKVTLFAVPDLYISDLRIVTDLDEDYRNAVLNVFVAISNAGNRSVAPVSLRLTIAGLPLLLNRAVPEIAPGSTWEGWLTGKVSDPLKWESEHPNLYTLKLELANRNETCEQVEKRFGFREIEIKGNELLVNGKAVKLRGVCRHEAHPLTGRVLTPELQRKDVELYRAANCNFIRTSHYPPAEELLEICDELGMFVEVEAPVCWMGHHANENWRTLNYRDSIYYPYVLQANMEMIHFYRNHPSVLFWSMANESYWNREFAQVKEYMKKADPTRPFTFHDQAYGGFNNQGSTAPVANIHYPGPDGYKTAARSDRPLIYGEYCHLNVYNRSELVTDPGIRSDWALALAPAWENMYRTKGVLGGSIWSGIDDIFQLPGGNAVGYGPWGPVDGWRRPKPEYWDMKKIYSPVRVQMQTLSPSRELKLEVENRYTFTNLDELQIEWQYGKETGLLKANIGPGTKGEIKIPVTHPEDANELSISFTDPRGFLIDEYRIPVGEQIRNELPEMAILPTRLKAGKDRYIITGKDFRCEIDRSTGQIISIKKGKKEILNGGPWLMALPLSGGGCFPDHNTHTPVFNEICSGWIPGQIIASEETDGIVVRVSGSYREFEGAYILKINAGGKLTVTYSFTALEDLNPRQWGLVFEAPVAYDKTFWRRKGLWSVYPSDHISRTAGEADLFYAGLPDRINPRVSPIWSWSLDYNELGSNDFRATRRNIRYAGLKDASGSKITALSDGRQHWRSWLEKDKIRFLVADFVTAGNEMFLSSYYAPYRKPLKKGDLIEGSIFLYLE